MSVQGIRVEPTYDAFEPVSRQRLSETLVQRIGGLIRAGDLHEGDRLPPTSEMARRFRVAAPTVREAIARLETLGMVSVRPGRGVYIVGG